MFNFIKGDIFLIETQAKFPHIYIFYKQERQRLRTQLSTIQI